MKSILLFMIFALGTILIIGIMGCGQSSSNSTTTPVSDNLSITQDVKITAYSGTSVTSKESLTLSASPSSIEFSIYSNHQDKIAGAQFSINYSSFSDAELQNSGGRFIVSSPSFSEGQNPISVKVIYSTGQTEYDYLKVIVASI